MEPGQVFDEWLEGALNRDRQVDAHGVHLTVAEVVRGHSKGKVDFGGSEHKPASLHTIEFFERSPGDKFWWWRLEAGLYVVRFNERLKEGAPPMLLTTSDRLASTGCAIAATVCTGGEIQAVLSVPECGVNVKQNARIAMLRPLG